MRRYLAAASVLSILSVIGLALAGCTKRYEATTVLHSDGSIERRIYQPAGEGADEGPRAQGWKDVRIQLNTDQGSSKKYFVASGTFANVGMIPDHVCITPDSDSPTTLPSAAESHLVRSYASKDYVFVVEHDWQETLQDHVTFAGMRKAREALLDQLIDVAISSFRDVLSKEYEVDGLEKWLNTDGRSWAAEFTDELFVESIQLKSERLTTDQFDERIFTKVATICAAHGLDLSKEGKPLDGDQITEALKQFAIDLACKTVRVKATGKPVDANIVAGWLEELDLGTSHATIGDDPKLSNRFQQAAEKVIAARYGGDDANQRHTTQLALDIAGVYWMGILTRHDFEYSMTAPGTVTFTNGELLSPSKVLWSFEGRMAWPMGYAMTLRSLEPREDLQQKLLHGHPLTDSTQMRRFIELVGDQYLTAPAPTSVPATSGSLATMSRLQTLRACRTAGSMQPLIDLRKRLAADNSRSREAAELHEIMQLLHIPD